MPIGKLVFAQLMDFLPLHTFRRCVARHPSNYPTKTFSHLDQYLSMAFAQLTLRESLSDLRTLEARSVSSQAHSRTRLSHNVVDATEKRGWPIYHDKENSLIAQNGGFLRTMPFRVILSLPGAAYERDNRLTYRWKPSVGIVFARPKLP